MSVRKSIQKIQSPKQSESNINTGCVIPSLLHPSLHRAADLIQKQDYAGAANLLKSAGCDVQVRNTLGVCLMRLGQIEQAVNVYRALVLIPGSVVERAEVSNSCKRNFATALLMKGLPSGTISVLSATGDSDHPIAVRLLSAIRQWEKSLSWFRWLDWKLNGVEPSSCSVPLDFVPGEFDATVQITQPIDPENAPNASFKTAA